MRGKQPDGAHKDCGAHRFMKNSTAYYGYTSHTLVDSRYRYIRKGVAADASVHDGKVTARFRKTEREIRPGFLPSAPVGRRGRERN